MEQNKEDRLSKEFDDWLDSIELTLPIPTPEEDEEYGQSTDS